jgi:hypothetical protein
MDENEYGDKSVRLIATERCYEHVSSNTVLTVTYSDTKMCGDHVHENNLILVASRNKMDGREAWLLDSGASCHVTNDATMMTDLKPAINDTIKVGNNEHVDPSVRGTVWLQLDQDVRVKLTDVFHVPNFAKNIISVTRLIDQQCKPVFEDSETFSVTAPNGTKITAKRHEWDKLFYFFAKRHKPDVVVSAIKMISINEAHRLCAHANK